MSWNRLCAWWLTLVGVEHFTALLVAWQRVDLRDRWRLVPGTFCWDGWCLILFVFGRSHGHSDVGFPLLSFCCWALVYVSSWFCEVDVCYLRWYTNWFGRPCAERALYVAGAVFWLGRGLSSPGARSPVVLWFIFQRRHFYCSSSSFLFVLFR